MFWKKKTEPDTAVELAEGSDQRTAFRYVFGANDYLTMTFKGREVRIRDISAGGLAFENKGFSKYDVDRVALRLDMPNFPKEPILSAQVRILHVSSTLCHSIFENCTVDEYEMVHKYVLEMQKKGLHRR